MTVSMSDSYYSYLTTCEKHFKEVATILDDNSLSNTSKLESIKQIFEKM